jgi:hypothetical protein
MPKLLLFAPCEKVIVDRETNSTSLITLLETVSLYVKESEEDKLPADARSPLVWSILALWQTEPGDESKKWEARVLIDIQEGLDVIVKFAFEPGKPNFRNVISVVGFPIKHILKLDICPLKLFFREEGAENWNVAADFNIVIQHQNRTI